MPSAARPTNVPVGMEHADLYSLLPANWKTSYITCNLSHQFALSFALG